MKMRQLLIEGVILSGGLVTALTGCATKEAAPAADEGANAASAAVETANCLSQDEFYETLGFVRDDMEELERHVDELHFADNEAIGKEAAIAEDALEDVRGVIEELRGVIRQQAIELSRLESKVDSQAIVVDGLRDQVEDLESRLIAAGVY